MNIAKALKSFRGGIPAVHYKRTQESVPAAIPLPEKVIIPMVQHIGAPCIPLVSKGEYVKLGQKIADADSPLCAPIHASVSGTVTDIRPVLYAGGFDVMAIEIESDGAQALSEQVAPPVLTDTASYIRAVRESGIVGLGGAGFPTSVKLVPPKPLDILVINGAECEPYITADYRIMIDRTQTVIDGIDAVMKITGVSKACIGIESNKPAAIKKFASILAGRKDITVMKLRSRYPQGGEKQMIYAVTGRIVPAGKLPFEAGVLVHNVATVSFIAEYLRTGMPLVAKTITVDGSAVRDPKNIIAPIGTRLRDIFEFCGGFTEDPAKIIMGGPMMGVAQFSLDTSVVKQTNALLALTGAEARIRPESACLKCGKCVDACPMNLAPLFINACVDKRRIEEALTYSVNDCIECGCCSYVCPASRHLVQSISYAKAELRRRAHGGKK
jgi:electron transport complex protein RnfC